jgi:hypothetical protein
MVRRMKDPPGKYTAIYAVKKPGREGRASNHLGEEMVQGVAEVFRHE